MADSLLPPLPANIPLSTIMAEPATLGVGDTATTGSTSSSNSNLNSVLFGTSAGLSPTSSVSGNTTPTVASALQAANNTATSITNITPTSFIAKVAYIILGIVVVGGAIYVYKKS